MVCGHGATPGYAFRVGPFWSTGPLSSRTPAPTSRIVDFASSAAAQLGAAGSSRLLSLSSWAWVPKPSDVQGPPSCPFRPPSAGRLLSGDPAARNALSANDVGRSRFGGAGLVLVVFGPGLFEGGGVRAEARTEQSPRTAKE
jgi:hypothetical protein